MFYLHPRQYTFASQVEWSSYLSTVCRYRPDELKVHTENNMVVVDGKHEERSADGRKVTCRQFRRAYRLPEGAKAEDVASNLSKDGVLVITAPKLKMD